MSDRIAAIKEHINGLRDTDAVQRYQEYAEMVELLDYVERLEAGYAELTASRDNENRQKNRIYLALELQSDLLADALGKTTREGLSYSDLVSEVKTLRTALAPFAAVGAAVAARPAYPPTQELMRVGEASFTVAHLIAAADVLAVRAEAVGTDTSKGGIAEIAKGEQE